MINISINFKKTFKHQSLVLMAIYFIIFFAFYSSYPLHHSLPSDQDSWYYLACFNFYNNYLLSSIQGMPTPSFFYPDSYPILNGEPSFSLYLLWLPFKLLLRSDLWSYFLLLITILSLNGIAVFKLIKSFFPVAKNAVAFVGGLVFNLNMFMFANLDNVNTLFWAAGIAAFVLFRRMLLEQKNTSQLIILISFLVLFQLGASVYNFLYTLLVVGLYAMFNFKDVLLALRKNSWLNYTLLVLGVTISFSYLYLIAIYPDKTQHWNFSQDLETLKLGSLGIKDFFRPLPHTLYSRELEVTPILQYRSFFFGFAFFLFGCAGMFIKFKDKKTVLAILLTSLIIGLGAYIEVFNVRVILPLGWLFEQFDLYGFYRFPFRIVMIMVLMWVLFISQFLNFLEKKTSFKTFYLLLIVFFGVFLMENVPSKRTYFEFDKYENEKINLQQTLADETKKTILILPVEDFIDNGADINIYRSEHIYMYWQTAFKQNLINGQAGHSPPHLQELVNALFYTENIDQSFGNYLSKYKVNTILFYGESWGFMPSRLDIDQIKDVALSQDVTFQYIN